MPTLSEKKNIARQSLEMWAGDATVDAAAIFTDGYVNHQEPAASGGIQGIDRATWATIVAANHDAFPDLKVEILSQIAEGDLVATHWCISATQTGPYGGTPPSGRPVSWTGVQIDRFEGDKIAESWVSWDKHTQLVQLGLIPPG